MEKYAAREVKHEIDRILWEVWDPIGVNEDPNARDEYSSYVNGVFELLVNGVSDDAIAAHLLAIVVDRMGIGGATVERMRLTVEALREIRLPS
jgi:hypothetical protein